MPGHEIVGEIGAGPRRGERVVVQPALGCAARGLEPRAPSARAGLLALCRHTTDGASPPACRPATAATPAAAGARALVAHESQLHPVPDELSDEDAVLVEPLACALHAAAVADSQPGETVAMIGAGTIGLLTLAAAARARARRATLARRRQAHGPGSAPRAASAPTTSCAPDRAAHRGRAASPARAGWSAIGGRELLLGGFDRVLDCVGTGASLEQAITVTRPRGRVVLVGMPGELKADLAAAWLRELELRGAYGYEHDFPAALEFAATLRPGRLIDRGWPLRDFKTALRAGAARPRARAA